MPGKVRKLAKYSATDNFVVINEFLNFFACFGTVTSRDLIIIYRHCWIKQVVVSKTKLCRLRRFLLAVFLE